MKTVLFVLALAFCATTPALAEESFSFEDAITAHKAKDYQRTLDLVVPAAENGNADAQNLLCYMYRYGQGVPANISTAYAWCAKAAESGHKLAQFNMGVAYEDGVGVEIDHAKAYEWYCRSALNDYIPAKEKTLEMFSMCAGGNIDACAAIERAKECSEKFFDRELSKQKKD